MRKFFILLLAILLVSGSFLQNRLICRHTKEIIEICDLLTGDIISGRDTSIDLEKLTSKLISSKNVLSLLYGAKSTDAMLLAADALTVELKYGTKSESLVIVNEIRTIAEKLSEISGFSFDNVI